MKKLPIYKKILFIYKFLKRNHYIPNISHPKTFNEKINHRKFFSENELFSICADKIAAKEYVSKALSSNEIIIPTLFSSDTISEDMIRSLLKIHDSFLIKANHNSGHIHFINKNSTKEKIISACNDLSKELRRDFGKRKNEGWYSKIKPRILFEENVKPPHSKSLTDYKFHVFKQEDGEFKIVLCVIFDRGNNPHCSYFDENLNWIPISQGYPCVVTKIIPPENYSKMVQIAKLLAKPFNYVRIDLYNINGKIYFGEFTFADGSGFEKFSSYDHDLWLGGLWKGDPCD